MTATEITIVIAAVATVLIPSVTLMVTTILGKLRDMDRKVDSVVTTVAAVNAHVNGEKTASNGREAMLQAEVKLLREVISENQATANLLAQQVAQATTSGVATPMPVEVVNVPADPVPTTQTP